MVFEIAPERNGCAAAIIFTCPVQLIERPPEGLGLSPLFDSTAGLQRLLQTEGEPAPPPRAKVRLGSLAWAAAYLLAGVGAIAIALG